MKKILAIDPGASGGFAWVSDLGVETSPMPETDGDIVNLINHVAAVGIEPWTVVMEDVGGYCGGAGAPGSAMFNFGRGVGFIHGVLAARGIRMILVRPMKWQKHFSLGTVKTSGGKTAWKNKLKQCAQRLFPQCDVTLKTADALLIFEYGQRNEL